MTMLKKTLMFAVALPMVLGSMSAFAAKDHHGMKGHHGERHIMKQLDLTDAQKDEMKALRQQNKEKMKSQRHQHRAERQTAHKALDKLLLASDFDEPAVRDLVQRMSEKQIEHRVERLKHRHQMLSVLTTEQKAKYTELKQQKAKKHLMN